MSPGSRTGKGKRALGREVARVVLGPWPLRPALLFTVLFVVNFYALNYTLDLSRETLRESWLQSIPISVAIACTGGLVVLIGRRIAMARNPTSPTRTQYLVTLIAAGVATGVVSYLVRLAFNVAETEWRGWSFYVVRGLVTMFIVHITAGVSDARLVAQVRRAELALQEVSRQRQVIIDSEERARGVVARFLHDNVQTGLVAISLQVRSIAARAPQPLDAELGSIVEALEEMRATDVRAASRRLSPDLDSVGLEQVVWEFLEPLRRSMAFEVTIDPALSEWSNPTGGRHRQSLAVYRIIEQAVLNSATHGQAGRVRITIDRAGDEIQLRVQDDGRGMSGEDATPGTGLRIVSAWTETIDGEWSLDPVVPSGAALSVRFTITSALR